MGRGGPEFEATSPFRKMPGFSDGDYALCDSSAIVAYLDAQYPDPNLIPTESRARGRAIWFDEFADTLVMAAGGKIFFNRFVAPKVLKQGGDAAIADAAERDELPPLLDYLEGVIPASGYLVEDRLTIADIAVASPFANLRHVGVVFNAARHPRSLAYVEAILARPSFAPMIEAESRLVAAMSA
jgi:glutathione S-transferase